MLETLANWGEFLGGIAVVVSLLYVGFQIRLNTAERRADLLERLNEEIRRRTRVARLFPNEASCLRLVTAIVMEIAEDWQTADKRYLTFND